MDVLDCVSAISTMLVKAMEYIQCIFCQDSSCFKIIINNFYNKLI